MSFLNLLHHLAGAQPDVLQKARTDRVKYTAMGGVLLMTAGVAGVSAAFALNTVVHLPAVTAVVAGALWAVMIFTLDRMLIVSMTRQSGWLRNLLMAVPRLGLAVVIGAVISVPLVLQIFQPEINSELQVIHSENLITAQKKLDEQFADITSTQKKVDQLQAVVSGTNQPSVSRDLDVVAAQQQVNAAQAAYDKAYAESLCELDGSCGTHTPGVGGAYLQTKAKADQAKAALDDAKAKLSEVTAAAQVRVTESMSTRATNREVAQRELGTLTPGLEQRKAERAAAQARLYSGELNDEGLLARLKALDRISAGSVSITAANWSLFVLFMLIEVLPVAVKLMSMTGPPTLYDRLLTSEEKMLETRAAIQNDVVVQIEQHQAAGQIHQGKAANAQLLDKQSEIAMKAIDAWGKIAISRADEELGVWVLNQTPSIFISHRQSGAGLAEMLYEEFTSRLGARNVFLDIQSARPGESFGISISNVLGRSDVVLALIDEAWLEAIGVDGRRRIEDPSDMPRREIVLALALGARVIPVLIDIPLLSAAQLPEDLAPLARLQSLKISRKSAQIDVKSIADAVWHAAGAKPSRPASQFSDLSEVTIYTSSDNGAPVRNAILELLAVYGFDEALEESPVLGSWFQRIFVRSMDKSAVDKLAEVAGKVERIAELKYIATPRAENDEREANAVARLAEALSSTDEAVIKTSSVLFIKMGGRILSWVLTEQEIQLLEERRELLRSPLDILDAMPYLQEKMFGAVPDTIIDSPERDVPPALDEH